MDGMLCQPKAKLNHEKENTFVTITAYFGLACAISG